METKTWWILWCLRLILLGMLGLSWLLVLLNSFIKIATIKQFCSKGCWLCLHQVSQFFSWLLLINWFFQTRSDLEMEEIPVKPSLCKFRSVLGPKNPEVKARPASTSSLNVSRNSQWCRSWISVQAGGLRCVLPLFIEWMSVYGVLYKSYVCSQAGVCVLTACLAAHRMWPWHPASAWIYLKPGCNVE